MSAAEAANVSTWRVSAFSSVWVWSRSVLPALPRQARKPVRTGRKSFSLKNLRALDLSHTAVTSEGARSLARLQKLESLNLTATTVDETVLAELQRQPSLKRVYFFQEEKKEVEEKTKTH